MMPSSPSLTLCALLSLSATLPMQASSTPAHASSPALECIYAPDSLDGYELELDFSQARVSYFAPERSFMLAVYRAFKGYEHWESTPHREGGGMQAMETISFRAHTFHDDGSVEPYIMRRIDSNTISVCVEMSTFSGHSWDMLLEFDSPSTGKLLVATPNGCNHHIRFRVRKMPPSAPQDASAERPIRSVHSVFPNALILVGDRAIRIQENQAYYSQGGDYDRYHREMPVIRFGPSSQLRDQFGQTWEELLGCRLSSFSTEAAGWSGEGYGESLNLYPFAYARSGSGGEQLVERTFLDQQGRHRPTGSAMITLTDGVDPKHKDSLRGRPIISTGIIHGVLYNPTSQQTQAVSDVMLIDYGTAGMELPEGYESPFTQLCQKAAETGDLAAWKKIASYYRASPRGLHLGQRELMPYALPYCRSFTQPQQNEYAARLRQLFAQRLASISEYSSEHGGNTMLHYAAAMRDTALVKYIAGSGYGINTMNHQNESALDWLPADCTELRAWMMERAAVSTRELGIEY